MKISVKRRFFLNTLTFRRVRGTFSLTDTVQLTARDVRIGGAIPRMCTLYVTRSHAKSGIHKLNHYPDHKNYKDHKKTSANYYWQPPPLAVIMF